MDVCFLFKIFESYYFVQEVTIDSLPSSLHLIEYNPTHSISLELSTLSIDYFFHLLPRFMSEKTKRGCKGYKEIKIAR